MPIVGGMNVDGPGISKVFLAIDKELKCGLGTVEAIVIPDTECPFTPPTSSTRSSSDCTNFDLGIVGKWTMKMGHCDDGGGGLMVLVTPMLINSTRFPFL